MRARTTLARVALLTALVVSSSAEAWTPREIIRDSGASYLRKSLDKTVVTDRGGDTHTTRSAPGSGTGYVTLPERERDCQDHDRRPHSDSEDRSWRR